MIFTLFKRNSNRSNIVILILAILFAIVGITVGVYAINALLNKEYIYGSFWTKEELYITLASSILLSTICAVFGSSAIISMIAKGKINP